MNRRKRSRVMTLITGFVLIKVIIVAVYLSGVLTLAGLPFVRETAVAQDEGGEPEATAAAETSTEVDKAEQYAEIQAVMNQLETKRIRLLEEENRIKNERDQLEKLKLDIDMQVEELKAIQTKIDEGLAQKALMAAQEQQQEDVAEAAKVKRLVKVYTSMSPKKAAEIIDKLDMNVVYQVFSNMKGEEVGQILTYVDGERAAKITEQMAARSE